MHDLAVACWNILGSDEAKKVVRGMFDAFDNDAKKSGKAAACKTVDENMEEAWQFVRKQH